MISPAELMPEKKSTKVPCPEFVPARGASKVVKVPSDVRRNP